MSIFKANCHHAFAQTDGTYKWPDSQEGDLLKQAFAEITELTPPRNVYAVMESVALGGPYGTDDLVSLHQVKNIAKKAMAKLEAIEADPETRRGDIDGYYIEEWKVTE
tara:strand:- start:404 stop:727 length:324 start_codon:yes stop_codon:yes gene_type:complete